MEATRLADLRIIKNSKRTPCGNCGGVHEYVSRGTEHAPCGTPVAMPVEKANGVARILAIGLDDVVRVPSDTVVVIDDAARMLPKREEPDLARYTSRERLA